MNEIPNWDGVEMSDWLEPGFVYTVATGRLFTSMGRFQALAEDLLDRSLMTHEFSDESVWRELREALETALIAKFEDET